VVLVSIRAALVVEPFIGDIDALVVAWLLETAGQGVSDCCSATTGSPGSYRGCGSGQ
jgi:hypothetical protein